MGLHVRVVAFLVVSCVVVGFGLGFLIGYLAFRDTPWIKSPRDIGYVVDETVSRRLLAEINPQKIKEHLRFLTSRPHLSGTEGDSRVIGYIHDHWKSVGLDPVKRFPYEVLLSSPEANRPNSIELHGRGGGSGDGVLFRSQPYEKILRAEQNQSDVVPPFNVYSKPGVVQGKLVYVNYGRFDDFEYLKKKRRIEINGTICIARYGKLFRADKVFQAQTYGCVGLILYTDPADFAVAGTDTVYPQSWWLPGTGVQRGTLKRSSGGIGDPLTPLYPSIESAYRIPESKAELPEIPVHPIGYGDAKVLLDGMAGEEVPEKWRGRLNVTYRTGPGFVNSDRYVKMNISTRSYLGTIENVVGFIEGAVEPDRYVIIGNHHDAWVFGALDPSSGTAIMLELSRAFAKLVSEGWRPRRTIVFCAWGAEEQGIIGSREWVEQFGRLLSDRAVAYLNVDIGVQGRHALRARALPMLKQLVFDAAKRVPNPDDDEREKGRKTVYDTWALRYSEKYPNKTATGKPRVPVLGSGSDFAPFVGGIGITSVDLRYHYDESLGISSYPLYHSVYETFHLYETFVDPQFKFSAALGQLWGELALRLADHAVLPFRVKDYGLAVEGYFGEVETRFGRLFSENDVSLDYFRAAVKSFSLSCERFQQRVDDIDSTKPILVRQLNDQMVQLERTFIDPPGLPNRPAIRHVLFAPSSMDSYTGISFPSLVDSLFMFENANNETKTDRWEEVKKQLSIVTFFVEAASASLSLPTHF